MFNVEFEEVTNLFCAEFDTVVHVSDANLGTKTITANDTYYAEDDGYDGYSEVTVNVSGGGGGTLETITKTYTPTTSQQTEQITPSSGYDGIAEVDVTVNAMPTGTEGTPTATKGSVSNHAVQVTPSVTNAAGYIEGGTKTGTAVTVSASELVSGTKSISANGTNIDVTDYAKVDVAVPNSYSAADEGKVVSNGALVAQTAHADVTPTTSDQTIDTTTNNSIKVKGDADLVAGNIKKDVMIFGVTGSYEGGGGASNLECGTFTIESDTKRVTLTHSLGVAPDFCIVYPINTPTATAAYRMNFQVLLRGLGQANYNISTNTSYNFGSPHNMGGGTGYNTGVAGSYGQGTPESGYAGTATTTDIKVGGINGTTSGGSLTAGTYGYILGVVS